MPLAACVVHRVRPAQPDNRRLVVEAEARTYLRSSQRQLDGEYEARTHVIEFNTLPAGDYKFRVRMDGVGGDIRGFDWQDFKMIGEPVAEP